MERIDGSPSQSQNPSNIQEQTVDEEMKVPEFTVYRKETENQNNRPSQRKKVRKEKTNLAQDFKYWWPIERRERGGGPGSNTPLDMDTGPILTNTNNITEDVIENGSQDLTVSSASNAPVKHSMSAEVLSGAEEYLPAPNIENLAVNETGSSSQDMTNHSAPDSPVKYPRIASAAEDFPPPTNGQKNTRKDTESGSQKLPNSSASADVSPDEQFPVPQKINGDTETVTGSGSLNLTASSMPKFPVKHSVSADVLPKEREEGIKNGSQDLTVSSAPNAPVEHSMSAEALSGAEEYLPAPNIENLAVKETGSSSQDMTNYSAPDSPVKHPPIASPAEDFPQPTNGQKNTGKDTESGSQKLPNSSASADVSPDEQFPVPQNINNDTETVTGSGSLNLTASSMPKVPVKHSARADVLSAIIISRAKVPDEPWVPEPTDWVPEDDNIQPSVEELEAGITFEGLYNVIRHRDGSPPPSPNNRRLPVFKHFVN